MNMGAKIDKNEQINKFFCIFLAVWTENKKRDALTSVPFPVIRLGLEDLLLRRQLLYPAELPDQKSSLLSKFGCKDRHFICNLQIFARKTEL